MTSSPLFSEVANPYHQPASKHSKSGIRWVFMEKNRLQLFREVQLFLEEPK
jgi:hypothetical protein